jgi:hypothetical protein
MIDTGITLSLASNRGRRWTLPTAPIATFRQETRKRFVSHLNATENSLISMTSPTWGTTITGLVYVPPTVPMLDSEKVPGVRCSGLSWPSCPSVCRVLSSRAISRIDFVCTAYRAVLTWIQSFQVDPSVDEGRSKPVADLDGWHNKPLRGVHGERNVVRSVICQLGSIFVQTAVEYGVLYKAKRGGLRVGKGR